MTCSACGNGLGPDVRFCPLCGAPAAPPPPTYAAYPPPPMIWPYNRVERNLQILGTMWLVYAVLRLCTGLIGMMFLHGTFGSHWGNSNFNLGWSPFGSMWLASIWPMAFFSLAVSIGCTVLTGFALITRQPWGRVLGIIFGILALIHIPLGTALGVYTLWVLAPRLSGDEYAALTDRRRPT